MKKKKKEMWGDEEDQLDIDEDSDIPVHEDFVKEKKVKKYKGFHPLE